MKQTKKKFKNMEITFEMICPRFERILPTSALRSATRHNRISAHLCGKEDRDLSC